MKTQTKIVWFLRTLFLAAGISTILSACFGAALIMSVINSSLSDEQILVTLNQPSIVSTKILDNTGKLIEELHDQLQISVPHQQIPPFLRNAIIAVEDRRFFNHPGFDVKAIARVLVRIAQQKYSGEGASTITQQLVRNLFLFPEKTILRKTQEIYLAYRVERLLKKDEILTQYCNRLFLGQGAVGVAAAAKIYFGKNLDQLSNLELAMIAGLFQSPTALNPMRHPHRALHKARRVLFAMRDAGMISSQVLSQSISSSLQLQTPEFISAMSAPYFVDYVRSELAKIIRHRLVNSGLTIETTLDIDLQNKAEQSIVQAPALWRKNSGGNEELERALLSIDPHTGAVRAMVGGKNYKQSQFNRTSQALRSPGSAFKPVIYSLALSRGRHWSDVMLVAPVSIEGYKPRNATEEFLSETTLLRAFYLSLNTAAVEIARPFSMNAVIEHAKNLGIQSPLKLETGTVLGSSSVTMLDLARVYSTFANDGKRPQIFAIKRVIDRNGQVIFKHEEPKDQTVAVSPEIAQLMTEGFRSVMTYGTAQSAASLAPFAVGKTGTSNASIDNWFCGYSRQLTTIVWVGHDQHLGLGQHASGATLALPIWQNFMNQALQSIPENARTLPQKFSTHLVLTHVHPRFGYKTPQGVSMLVPASFAEKMNEQSGYEHLEKRAEYRSVLEY